MKSSKFLSRACLFVAAASLLATSAVSLGAGPGDVLTSAGPSLRIELDRPMYAPGDAAKIRLSFDNPTPLELRATDLTWSSALYLLNEPTTYRLPDLVISELLTRATNATATSDQDPTNLVPPVPVLLDPVTGLPTSGNFVDVQGATVNGVGVLPLERMVAFLETEKTFVAPPGARCALPVPAESWTLTFNAWGKAPPGLYLLTATLHQAYGGKPVTGYSFFVVQDAATAPKGVSAPSTKTGCQPLPGTGTRTTSGSATLQAWREFIGRWPSMPVPWRYNPTNIPLDLDYNAAQSAIQASFDEWENDQGSYYDPFPMVVDFGANPDNNVDTVNTVGWVASFPYPAEALCRADGGSLEMLECDLRLNRDVSWTTTPVISGKRDLQSGVTHEAGHFLGLDHTDNSVCASVPATQVFTMCSGGYPEQNYRRSIEWGDRAGIRYMYPGTYETVTTGTCGVRCGAGSETGDIDVASGAINVAGQLNDIVVAWADNPSGLNAIYYRTMFDIDSNSGASAYAPSNIQSAVGPNDCPGGSDRCGVGEETQGVGAGIGQFDGDSRPDLLVTWIDNPPGENHIYYRILWNLNGDGSYTSAGPLKLANGNMWVGGNDAGLGACVADINGNGRQDVIFAWMDDPDGENYPHYRVAYDIGVDSMPAGGWSGQQDLPSSWHGHVTAGFDAACSDFDGGGTDLVLGWIDDAPGNNHVFYNLGGNLYGDGSAQKWDPNFVVTPRTYRAPGDLPEWWGDSNQGLGITEYNANNNQGDEITFAWVDNPAGENRILYRTEWDGQYLNHN